MYVLAGTLNPAKLNGAEAAIRLYWPEARFAGVRVDHGTDEQPRSRDQTIGGAVARARLALAREAADIGLGIEGGTVETPYGTLVELWVAAADRSGAVHIGSGPSIVLPEPIAARVRKGCELGPVVDDHFRRSGQKQAGGVIALLTGGHIVRADACRQATLCALAPFRHADVYAGR